MTVLLLLMKIIVISLHVEKSEGLGLDLVKHGTPLHEPELLFLELIKTLDLPHFPEVPDEKKFKEQFDLGLNNEDMYMNFTHLATKYRRNVSTHEVITRDGYILTLFRLYGIGKPVLLMHGLFSSAVDWITPGPESSIAYLLNDEDYDVWLGNSRGNIYSRRHVTLSPEYDAPRFWNFSWHEIGIEDVPVTIDYILSTTGHSSLKYIGHSEGGTVFFVMCSSRPEYNKKISIMIGLAPAVWVTHLRSPILQILAKINPVIDVTAKLIGLHEVLPNMELIRLIKNAVCGNTIVASTVCTSSYYIGGGFNYGQQNNTNLPVILSHGPSSVASKQLIHFSQLVTSARFQHFDYGAKNFEIYNSVTPPCYPLEKITVPVALMYGDEDWLVTPRDTKILADHLKNLIELIRVDDDNFNHFDFLWAIDIKTLIMPHLLRILNSY